MARTFTLAQLRDRVRELIDAEQMRAVSDLELNKRLSNAYAKYYARLAQSGLGYPPETTATLVSTGTDTYPLPADHFATLRIDYQLSPQWWDPLDLIDIRDIHRVQWQGSSQAFWYRLSGQNLQFLPTPAAGGTYRHIYAPAPADLTSDAQTVDGVTGWEDAVVLDAAIRCAMKWEGDVAGLVKERDDIDTQINEQIDLRSAQTAKGFRQQRLKRFHDLDAAYDPVRAPLDPADWPYWWR